MNRSAILPLLFALAFAVPPAARAQTATADAASASAAGPAQIAAERARIARQRHEAESEFAAAQQACWQKFAVNDCLRRAQRARRERMDTLRQQEWALDDQQRSHRAQERLRRIEGKER
ncbi:MAG: hypothetical protein LBI48_11685 [Burkholderiaceae bacterium]|jgi:hypothetical protein|nr:hypothetical protein [Burkholderiaceae bacterium]